MQFARKKVQLVEEFIRMSRIEVTKLKEVSSQILVASGVPTEDAQIITDTILDAHKKGRHSHGIGRLSIYIRKINSGQMNAETIVKTVSQTPIISILDANNGFGQVAAYKGMSNCIKVASEHGIGVATVKNSNSFGSAGYFGEMATKQNMIGVVMGNASPALAPQGGSKAILGTNPICFSFPGTDEHPSIVLDMACSVAARGKIRLAAKNGEKIPLDWAKDADGNPTDDPTLAILGSLNPIGDYKGFGLALVVDIMAGLLSGAAFGGDVKALNTPSGFSNYGHFLAALNPDFFLSRKEYNKRLDYLINNIKYSGETGAIFMPGERSHIQEMQSTDYVDLPSKIIRDINDIALEFQLSEKL
jgi:L-2-hydroxycarboxylate dehydrogenase (NAD+)